MKRLRSVLLVGTLLSLMLGAQGGQLGEDRRFAEIKAKHERGEKISEEERDYRESLIERQNQESAAKRNADYAGAHPPRQSTGLVPLTDLGQQTYQGQQGGLYPGGENSPPSAHLQAGLRLARISHHPTALPRPAVRWTG